MASTTLQGLPASPGIAVGRCWTVDRRKVRTPRRNISAEEVEAELARLEAAIELSVRQLDGVKAGWRAPTEVGVRGALTMASITLQGLPASPGIAVGRCWTVDRRRVRTPRRKITAEEVEAELARLEAAIELSVHQLDGVKARMEAADGAEHLAILEVHRAMLRDPSLVDESRRLVREERVNVEWAVKRTIRKIKGAFSEDDEFFRERRSDVDYVGERIVKNLLGQGVDVAETPPPGSIVVARDLSPADTAILFHDRKVAGLVTDAGGITSHTAIVARALEIPAVVGAGKATTTAERGDWIVVDGGRGLVVVNPSAGERADYEAARIRQMEREAELARLKDLPAETVDGVRLRMLGNIEFGEEVPGLLSHGGEGVGLYRTEFLFMGRERAAHRGGPLPRLPRPSSRPWAAVR